MSINDIEEDTEEYIKRWKVKQLINQLNSVKGNGTSMITLIIPKGGQVSRVQKMLTEEYGTATNIKSHVNKLSVQEGIRSAQEKLKLYKEIPENGLVVCVGKVLVEGNREKKMSIDFEPFKPINKFIYKCDNKFHTEALTELLEDDAKYGFIIVDGSGAVYATLSGSNKEILARFTVDLPKKHGRGGQSSMRFARIRLEKRHNYLRKVAETATSVFITNDLPNVSGLILAGSSVFKKQLSQTDMFDKRLKSIVLSVIDIAYGGEAGLNQAILYAQETLRDVKFVKERKLLSAYFEEINKDSGRYCYGVQDTMYGLEGGAVETLIVWEELSIRRLELLNPTTQKKEIRYIKPEDIGEQANFYDSENVELEVVSDNLLVEWLADNYKNYGARLELTTDKSTEGSQFAKGFGGIGGFMRFTLEFPDNEIDEESFDSEDFI
eukprot:TRINITY_DN988_c0_g1_i1.p1 TRINITY_DN988_c0_g1~~TRINITY_DN988_c0_g1_i1.p1  ORF type:complete len:437 (+),score=149.05 TRINITY_DN988_c0_g1_i1:855-2165(+)